MAVTRSRLGPKLFKNGEHKHDVYFKKPPSGRFFFGLVFQFTGTYSTGGVLTVI